MQNYWFLALMASVCLEGLGRRYLPQVPGFAFYVLKDAVLIIGWVLFRPGPAVQRVGRYLYRGFGVVWIGTVVWSVIEAFNSEQPSFALAALGLRAYTLWWIAPPIVAMVLQSPYHRRRAIYVLAFFAIGISLLAIAQFLSPANSAINVYTYVDGEELHASEAGIVASTGRARVASTFAFITGFGDFTILIPVLLLSLGLETSDRRLRYASLIGTLLTAIATPMSGSRASVLFGVGVLVVTCWAAGLFFTPIGRRILVGGILGIVLAVVVFPEAIFGVQSRFAETEETQSRVLSALTILPPVALSTLDYPMGGAGTGSMQNAAWSLTGTPKWMAELELHRYLVELGPVGFLLAWATKLGLLVAFLRAYSILKRAGRRASAGAALSYAAITFFGNITFDHVWQSLYFIVAGFILAEAKEALGILAVRAKDQTKAVTVGPPPVSLRA
jgi:hypothetical protein